jgi:hypothetical protein
MAQKDPAKDAVADAVERAEDVVEVVKESSRIRSARTAESPGQAAARSAPFEGQLRWRRCAP